MIGILVEEAKELSENVATVKVGYVLGTAS